jgi:hypothetical protein
MTGSQRRMPRTLARSEGLFSRGGETGRVEDILVASSLRWTTTLGPLKKRQRLPRTMVTIGVVAY